VFKNPDYYTKAPEIKIELNDRQKIAVGYLAEHRTIRREEYANFKKIDLKRAFIVFFPALVGVFLLNVIRICALFMAGIHISGEFAVCISSHTVHR